VKKPETFRIVFLAHGNLVRSAFRAKYRRSAASNTSPTVTFFQTSALIFFSLGFAAAGSSALSLSALSGFSSLSSSSSLDVSPWNRFDEISFRPKSYWDKFLF
jgi:hypothetical protein